MIKTKRQKYIKEKYFKLVDHNPLHYAPLCDEKFRLSPMSLEMIINMIINILETEAEGEIKWEKIT